VVLEAFEMEKPVLASRMGGLGEIVVPGVSGFLFDPGDVAGFHKAVRDLMELTSEQRRAMGRNGREWASEATEPERWAKSYAELAQRAVERKKQQRSLGV
jgi:glycosyltransferase involved in cell wall biosynthesis